VAALVRGDHELSDIKLRTLLGVEWVALADAETVQRLTGAEVGFAGPIGLKVRTVADQALRGITGAVTGANETDHHYVDVDQARDFANVEPADLRLARVGDPCPRCADGVFDGHRGIEVGNIFYLGTKYSVPMKATYLDASGQERPMEMGCYGIGITRTAAAAVEQHHDDNGIIWPMPLAPVHVSVVPVNWGDQRMRETAEDLYAKLQTAGVEVLLDDREERPGIKFKDADLLGIPLRVTIGAKSLERNCVELKGRREKGAQDVPLSDIVDRVATQVRAELSS
jgi:prolyl-tRNA synthetase